MMNQKERGFFKPLIILALAGVVVIGGVFFLSGRDRTTTEGQDDDTIQDLVGNQDLDESKLPGNVKKSLEDVNKVVDVTDDCSAGGVSASIPKGWQCRKSGSDFTLYTDNNTLNVSIGKSQGMSSCSVIPGCTTTDVSLSSKFKDMKKMVQPTLGSTEIVGVYSGDSSIKVLVTSNDALSEDELTQIRNILDSVR